MRILSTVARLVYIVGGALLISYGASLALESLAAAVSRHEHKAQEVLGGRFGGLR